MSTAQKPKFRSILWFIFVRIYPYPYPQIIKYKKKIKLWSYEVIIINGNVLIQCEMMNFKTWLKREAATYRYYHFWLRASLLWIASHFMHLYIAHVPKMLLQCNAIDVRTLVQRIFTLPTNNHEHEVADYEYEIYITT